MKKPYMPFLMLILCVILILTGCSGNTAPTDPGYTDEEIWARCVESVEGYFRSDSMHILVDSVVVLGESELHVASEQWYSGADYYTESVQNGGYRSSSLQVNGQLYAQYADGEWRSVRDVITDLKTYRDTNFDETDGSGVSWEISENEIRVTHQDSGAESDAVETDGSRITTYVFDLEWRLVQINIISVEPTTEVDDELVIREVRQTISCYDTDEAVIKQRIDDAFAQVSSDQ